MILARGNPDTTEEGARKFSPTLETEPAIGLLRY